MEHFGALDGYDRKGPVDLVSVADQAAQQLLVDGLLASFPGDVILAEEEFESSSEESADGQSSFRWIIDPWTGPRISSTPSPGSRFRWDWRSRVNSCLEPCSTPPGRSSLKPRVGRERS